MSFLDRFQEDQSKDEIDNEDKKGVVVGRQREDPGPVEHGACPPKIEDFSGQRIGKSAEQSVEGIHEPDRGRCQGRIMHFFDHREAKEERTDREPKEEKEAENNVIVQLGHVENGSEADSRGERPPEHDRFSSSHPVGKPPEERGAESESKKDQGRPFRCSASGIAEGLSQKGHAPKSAES